MPSRFHTGADSCCYSFGPAVPTRRQSIQGGLGIRHWSPQPRLPPPLLLMFASTISHLILDESSSCYLLLLPSSLESRFFFDFCSSSFFVWSVLPSHSRPPHPHRLVRQFQLCHLRSSNSFGLLPRLLVLLLLLLSSTHLTMTTETKKKRGLWLIASQGVNHFDWRILTLHSKHPRHKYYHPLNKE